MADPPCGSGQPVFEIPCGPAPAARWTARGSPPVGSAYSGQGAECRIGPQRHPTKKVLGAIQKPTGPRPLGQDIRSDQQEETHTMSKKLFISLFAPLLVTAALVAMPAVASAACAAPGKCHYYINAVGVNKLALSENEATPGRHYPTLSWGTLDLKSSTGTEIECQNAIIGDIENPESGGPGRSETENWTATDCRVPGCEPNAAVEGQVVMEGLPWAAELQESGKFIRTATLAAHAEPWLSATEEPPEASTNAEAPASQSGAVVTTGCAFRPGLAGVLLGETGKKMEEEDPYKSGDPDLVYYPGAPKPQCIGPSKPKAINGSHIGSSPSEVEFDQPATGVLACTGSTTGETTGNLKVQGYEGEELINTF